MYHLTHDNKELKMHKMVVYMDGGSQAQPGTRKYLLSYGVVAHHNDTTVELHGALTDVPSALSGSHEHLAFVETLRHAKALSLDPVEVAFVTDDASVCDVNTFARNFGRVDVEHNTVKRLTNLLVYMNQKEDLYQYMLDCLFHSKFTKVKGHARCVYNLRCDDLAVHARNWAKGDLSPLLTFEEWLHDGHGYYDRDQQFQRWYAPFSDLRRA
jgi:ribonuclease HI